MNILEKIQALGVEVASDQETRDTYSHDASLFEIVPEAVVFPKTGEEVKKLVRLVADEKVKGSDVSLTARSGGTDMTGGPLSTSLVLNCTKYLNRIKEIGDEFAVAEPGVFYRDFEKKTLEHGLLLPSYPASREICALGGIVSNNSGGEKTLTYGKTERYVEELKMVLSDGNEYAFRALTKPLLDTKMSQNNFEGRLYRQIFTLIDSNYDAIQRARPKVSKNSSGYYLWNVYDKKKGIFDLTKLFTGAQGTLGIMTEVKFKLIKPKTHSRLLVIFLKEMDLLGEIAKRVLSFKPESFESYDDHTFKLALKFLPAMAKQLKGNMLSLGLAFLPEFFMVLTGGIPKLVLMAEFSGDTPEEAEEKVLNAHDALADLKLKTKVVTTEREMKKYWTVRRESFNLLRKHVQGMRTAPFIDDFIVHPSDLSEFLPKLYEILDRYDILYTIAGHVGDANFHIIPLMDFRDTKSKDIIKNLSKEVYKLVFEYGGSMSAEHNDGLIRTPFLPQMFGNEICDLFKKTKEIFDPLNIFNPGKKISGNLSFALDHLVKK